MSFVSSTGLKQDHQLRVRRGKGKGERSGGMERVFVFEQSIEVNGRITG